MFKLSNCDLFCVHVKKKGETLDLLKQCSSRRVQVDSDLFCVHVKKVTLDLSVQVGNGVICFVFT